MTQSLVLSIDVCRGLGISPLRISPFIWLSFSQADLGSTSAHENFFSGFGESLELVFLKICAHSERYRNLVAGIFEFNLFSEASRFHCRWSLFFLSSSVDNLKVRF